jgi:uncharacterized protein (DUF983 family)
MANLTSRCEHCGLSVQMDSFLKTWTHCKSGMMQCADLPTFAVPILFSVIRRLAICRQQEAHG